MKLNVLLLFPFALATANTFAQIPNSGFETWGTDTDNCAPYNQYANPTGWVGGHPTSCTDIGYSIQKITDNYPVGTGQYSILIQSNNSIGVFGIAETGNHPGNAKPTFSITGHPTSLTGYYKFAPLNGDTMRIAIVLFKNGSRVSGGLFTSTASVSNWTSFNIPFSTYASADSGLIVLSAYNAAGSPPKYVPHGNSALSIDNLNFDNLITTGITQIEMEHKISVYPNPFSSETTLQTNENLRDATLAVYNSLGQQVKQIKNIGGQTITLRRDDLPNGLYFLRLAQDNKSILTNRLIITD